MTPMQKIDLLIIGSGPAGLSTALHLLQRDRSWAGRMVLIEKAAHPRHKLCGGALPLLGLVVLSDLGLPLPLPVPQAGVEDVRFVYGERTIHIRGRPQLLVFHRAELDTYLAQQARQRGAVIHQDENVEGLSIDSHGVNVKTSRDTYSAQVVVGADGSKGATRRLLRGGEAKSRVARALEVTTLAPLSAPQFLERYALFDFTGVQEGLQGYSWDFPTLIGGLPHFNRGVYDARIASSRPRANLPELLSDSLASLGDNPARVDLEGHPLHWFSPRNRFAVPRLLLVGDAAGVDPLFGEGIAPALGYGKVAAEALQHAFVKDDFSFRDYRWRILRSEVGRYLIIRWCVAWWSYRLSGKSWFMHALWSFGGAQAAVWPEPQPLPAPSLPAQPHLAQPLPVAPLPAQLFDAPAELLAQSSADPRPVVEDQPL